MRDGFVDEVLLDVRSGAGGAGAVSFRREKCVAKGGPDGGDGGKGGDVLVVVSPQMHTLLDYRFQPRQWAENGQPGQGSQCSGRSGKDCILPVPRGTLIRHGETNAILADLTEANQSYLLAQGGRGGKGNEHFKSATRQTPRFAQPGEPAIGLPVRLELKLLADVGLIGLPNVGKSSLVRQLSAATPAVANYPFTTLRPHLGVVRRPPEDHFVIADVPGLIPDAHLGAGLGNRFLRHVSRVAVLGIVITIPWDNMTSAAIAEQYDTLLTELGHHDAGLLQRPRVLIFNQIDLPHVAGQQAACQAFAEQVQLAYWPVSALTGAGMDQLRHGLADLVCEQRLQQAETNSLASAMLPTVAIAADHDSFMHDNDQQPSQIDWHLASPPA